MQRQEISPYRRADHGEGEEEELDDYGAGDRVSNALSIFVGGGVGAWEGGWVGEGG